MNNTIVIHVNGEVFSGKSGSDINSQKKNTRTFAEGISSILTSGMRIAVLHGNKPQVGFVLYRSEVASHVLHSIPLDVCGADTQGATGYLISQAFMNVLRKNNIKRRVVCTVTQTLVDDSKEDEKTYIAIGPWYDRERAERYKELRNWKMIEEPGYGYRRAVPSLPPKKILEMEDIKSLVDSDSIVIAGGGGGVPVVQNSQGELEGIEAVVGSEKISYMFAKQLGAKTMLMVVEGSEEYNRVGLNIEQCNEMSLQDLNQFLEKTEFESRTINEQMQVAAEFLNAEGELVIITTLNSLSGVMKNKKGLWIGSTKTGLDFLR